MRDIEFPPSETYTDLNNGSLIMSWLNHCLLSNKLFNSLSHWENKYNFSTTDFCSSLFSFNADHLSHLRQESNKPCKKWNLENSEKFEVFQELVHRHMRALNFSTEASSYTLSDCSSEKHLRIIDSYYKIRTPIDKLFCYGNCKITWGKEMLPIPWELRGRVFNLPYVGAEEFIIKYERKF